MFCAAIPNVTRRYLNLEIPHVGDLEWDGGTYAYVEYFNRRGKISSFKVNGLPVGTLIGRKYHNLSATQDSRNGQGHVAVVLPGGRLLQSYDTGGASPA